LDYGVNSSMLKKVTPVRLAVEYRQAKPVLSQ